MTSAVCPRGGAAARAAVDDDAEHGRLGREVGVAGEDRLALRAEVAVDRQVGEHLLLRLRVGLRARALVGHELVERAAVDGEPRLLGHLERELDREAVGVVQQERGVAREPFGARLLGRRDRDVEDRRARGERAQERLLLAEGELLDLGVVVATSGYAAFMASRDAANSSRNVGPSTPSRRIARMVRRRRRRRM